MISLHAKLPGWRAQPLTEAAKNAKFRETMNLRAERHLLGQTWRRAGWIIGGSGFGCILLSIAGWVALLIHIMNTSDARYYTADSTTGYIGPAITSDKAALTFPISSERMYTEIYIRAREGWVVEADRTNDYQVKLMSCKAEQERYAAWRKTAGSPMLAVGKTGAIEVSDFHFFPRAADGKDNRTKHYMVMFKRTLSKDGSSSTKNWSATVDFEWHPEMRMAQEDRDRNAGGYQACGYSSDVSPG